MGLKTDILKNFEQLIENNPDGITIHAEGIIKYVNNRALSIFGASSKEEVLGKSVFDFLHPSYHEIAKKRIKKAIENMEPTSTAEYEAFKLDGSVIDIELTSLPFICDSKPAMQISFKDISERKRTYKVIKASEEKFRSLFETAPDSIILMNADNNIVSWNKSAKKLLGYTYEEIIGKSWLILIPKRFRNSHIKKYETLKKNPPKIIRERLELAVLTKSGKEIPTEMTIGYWKINGDLFLTIILRDISERKQFEDKLRYLATTDHLTGILNRRTGLMLIEQALKTAKRDKNKITLCYLDLDNFKKINDSYGHVEGDKVLRKVAILIKDNLRESDIFCRLGGDEFIIAWHDLDNIQSEKQWKRVLSKFNEWSKTEYKSTLDISAGFACPNLTETIDIDKLIDQADKKMYEAKGNK